MKINKIAPIVFFVVVTLAFGALSGSIVIYSTDWYSALKKPFFTLPNSFFAPVWFLLYILIGIAAGRVWLFGKHHRWGKTALYHYGAQLIFNVLWSMVFFGLRSPLLGLGIIIILLILVERSIYWFKLVDRTASLLLYPCLVWTGYVTLLSGAMVYLNGLALTIN